MVLGGAQYRVTDPKTYLLQQSRCNLLIPTGGCPPPLAASRRGCPPPPAAPRCGCPRPPAAPRRGCPPPPTAPGPSGELLLLRRRAGAAPAAARVPRCSAGGRPPPPLPLHGSTPPAAPRRELSSPRRLHPDAWPENASWRLRTQICVPACPVPKMGALFGSSVGVCVW